MSEPSSPPAGVRRGVGRPRRLTREAIVEAACEIGIDRLDMGVVAGRLKTGVATLYGYVKGREELRRLVVERMTLDADVGGSATTWQDVLREHASICFSATADTPEALVYLVNEDPSEVENVYAKGVVGKLVAHGLTAENATLLYVEALQLVIGAAICRNRARRIIARGDDQTRFLEGTLGHYRPTLERIIRDHERGELPAGRRIEVG